MEASVGEQLAANRAHSRSGRWQAHSVLTSTRCFSQSSGSEDAGISGGTLERPGLQRLLADIDAGLVDQIVVYKVDRLTRSLSDFAKLVERLEAAGAVFVSVTQSFNTATSMGRLTLHMGACAVYCW